MREMVEHLVTWSWALASSSKCSNSVPAVKFSLVFRGFQLSEDSAPFHPWQGFLLDDSFYPRYGWPFYWTTVFIPGMADLSTGGQFLSQVWLTFLLDDSPYLTVSIADPKYHWGFWLYFICLSWLLCPVLIHGITNILQNY